jgi:YD repeat-containing protein
MAKYPYRQVQSLLRQGRLDINANSKDIEADIKGVRNEISQALTLESDVSLDGQLSVGSDGTTHANAQERLITEHDSVSSQLTQIVEEMTLQGETTLTYDAEGNLTMEETPVGVTTYEYENGRLVKSLEEKDGKTIESTFNFDAEGNLLSINRVVI